MQGSEGEAMQGKRRWFWCRLVWKGTREEGKKRTEGGGMMGKGRGLACDYNKLETHGKGKGNEIKRGNGRRNAMKVL